MFTKMGKALIKEEINQVGENLGIVFPHDFAVHYTQYNGGYPDKEYFYSEQADMEKMIQLFSPLNEAVEKYTKYKERIGNIMSRYFPFANDYGANPFCIDLETGAVCVIYMDVGAVTETSPIRVAANFESFVSGLSETSIDDDDDDE